MIGHSYGTTLVGSAADHGTLNADDVITAGGPGGPTTPCSEPNRLCEAPRLEGQTGRVGAPHLPRPDTPHWMRHEGNREHRPSAGTSTSQDAADAMKKLSSEIHGLIGVEGTTSDSNPGVMDCAGKNREKYFRVFHSWSFIPPHPAAWTRRWSGSGQSCRRRDRRSPSTVRDTSKNRNLSLTADNDARKAGPQRVPTRQERSPKLSLMLVPGCYEIPAGQGDRAFLEPGAAARRPGPGHGSRRARSGRRRAGRGRSRCRRPAVLMVTDPSRQTPLSAGPREHTAPPDCAGTHAARPD